MKHGEQDTDVCIAVPNDSTEDTQNWGFPVPILHILDGSDTCAEAEQMAYAAIVFVLKSQVPVLSREAGEEIGHFWITVHRHALSAARWTA